MNKNQYYILGLAASSLAVLANILLVIDISLNETPTHWISYINMISPLYEICILLTLRFILVSDSGFRNFRIPIDMIIIFKYTGFMISLFVSLKIIAPNSVTYMPPVIGIVLILLYLLLIIMMFRMGKHVLAGQKILLIFLISFLSVILLNGALPYLIKKGGMLRLVILKAIESIPYLIMVTFLLINRNKTKEITTVGKI